MVLTAEMNLEAVKQILSSFDPDNTDARRLFHGRGHCFPGLQWFVIDYFAPVLWVSVYSLPDENALTQLKATLLDVDSEVIAIQHRYDNYRVETLRSEMPLRWYARENGLSYQLETGQQNIGLFLDMRPLREWLANHAANTKVLNLFAYTCSLSVAAAQGGASSIVNVDLSSRSLGKGQLNHHLNKLTNTDVKYLAHNIFKSWGKIKKHGPYDIIIVDPPSFQKGSFEMSKDYSRLLKKLSDLVSPDAVVFLALNAPGTPKQWLLDLLQQLELDWQLQCLMPRAPGFTEKHEDAGLKVLKMIPRPPAVDL